MATVKRILIVLVIGLMALSAAVAVSVPLDRLLARGRVEAVSNATIPGSAGPLHVYVARPAEGEGPFPLVVMIHEFWGLDEATVGKAELLAQDGYVVVAPDLMRGRATRWLPTAIWQTIRTPDDRVRSDLDATIAAFATDPGADAERVAVMGFCFGGRMSLRYALERPQVRATGVFYGNVDDDVGALRRLGGPVLGVFGAEDASIPLAEVAAFERALAAADVLHEIHVFDGVGHAFVRTVDEIASDPVQAEAWALLRDFLRRHLADDATVDPADGPAPAPATAAVSAPAG